MNESSRCAIYKSGRGETNPEILLLNDRYPNFYKRSSRLSRAPWF